MPSNPSVEAGPPVISVFVCYAREDFPIVEELRAALGREGVDVRGDWLLQAGEEYPQQLRRLILESDHFLYLISPEATASPECRKELDHAVEMNKRILPVVVRDFPAEAELPAAVRRVQWIFLRVLDDRIAGIKTLLVSLRTDLDRLQGHRHLLVAADGWQASGRKPGYLLRSDALEAAERWITAASASRDLLPRPTNLQSQFLLASQAARRVATRWRLGIASALAIGFAGWPLTLSSRKSRPSGVSARR